MASPHARASGDIAIIALTCRVPSAETPEDLWAVLRDGMDVGRQVDEQELIRRGLPRAIASSANYVKIDRSYPATFDFDASFFGFTPRDAEVLDPQVRVFLELAWETLERAGYDPSTYAGRIGVYAGMGKNDYVARVLADERREPGIGEAAVSIANDLASLTTTVSYKLGLTGPSVTVQTACSTSLVAVHLACQALRSGDCEMALVGGISLSASPVPGYWYQPGGILSPDGRCRAFDDSARGTVPGEGGAAVLLKTEAAARQDGDIILARIKGSAINNDGAAKVGFTAPSVNGQADVISLAIAESGLTADDIGLVECHGTGTSLGDPIEIAGLVKAFRRTTQRDGFCAIGSIKGNIGHTNAAAGLAGLVKAVLALQHHAIPPTLYYERQNRQLNLASTPFVVSQRLVSWQGPAPRRAGVSSFGIGGTNAHVIVEEVPPAVPRQRARPGQELLVLSARTDSARRAVAQRLAAHLERGQAGDLSDVAHTLQIGRRHFRHRAAVVGDDVDDAVSALRDDSRVIRGVAPERPRPVVFVFPGQGAQVAAEMARQLYTESRDCRATIDRCCELASQFTRFDLREVLLSGHPSQDTAVNQPALFIAEYALATAWQSWGVAPAALLGHSLGEYVAACVAGIVNEEDALRLVILRGSLMQETPAGRMLAVAAPAESLAYADFGLNLAAINSASQAVVSGGAAQIESFREHLLSAGIPSRLLETDRAFHSSLMGPMQEVFSRALGRIAFDPPRIPVAANVTGEWMANGVGVSPEYWVSQALSPVRFRDCIATVSRHFPECAWLELGPGRTLCGLVREMLPTAHVFSDARDGRLGRRLETLGAMWVNGVAVDWRRLRAADNADAAGSAARVCLPTYPFERERYCRDVSTRGRQLDHGVDSAGASAYLPRWSETSVLAPGRHRHERPRCVVLRDGNAISAAILAQLKEHYDVVDVGSADISGDASGDAVASRPAGDSVDLASDDGTSRWWRALWERGPVATVVDLLPLADARDSRASSEFAFWSLVRIARAHGRHRELPPVEVVVVTAGVHSVYGNEPVDPEKATVLGAIRVIPQEYERISIRHFDISSTIAAGDVEQLCLGILNGADRMAAIRGGKQWVRTVCPVSLPKRDDVPHRLRQRGTYLITGGTGRIGLAIAAFLVRAVDANVALVGRGRRAEEAGQQSRGVDGDEALRRLQTLGVPTHCVRIFSADVGSLDQMAGVVAAVREEFGGIHGLIHAAGHTDPNGFVPLDRVDPDLCRKHLRAKRDGLLVLESVLRDDPLDFALLCSSLSSILGGLGHAAYASANAFMDQFAVSRRARDPKSVWTSVNWDGWNFGAAAPDRRSRVPVLDPERGMEVFAQIWSTSTVLPQILVSAGQMDKRWEIWVGLPRAESESHEEQRPAPAAGAPPEDERPRAGGSEPDEPGDVMEAMVSRIWSQVLGRIPASRDDDFFELGGNSLTAIRVLALFQKELNCEVPIDTVFEWSTVAGLARRLTEISVGVPALDESQPAVARPPAVTPRRSSAPVRLSFAQERLWLLHALHERSTEYHMPQALRLRGALQIEALERALTTIVERHESLRTHFGEEDGVPVQIIGPARPVMLPQDDLTGLDEAAQKAHIQAVLREEWQTPFDLRVGPLWRARLLRLAATDHVLVRTIHHIVSDGWSQAVFNNELMTLYLAYREGRENPLAPLRVQYADFALWQRQWLEAGALETGLAYWKQQLAGVPDRLELPTDRPRPAQQTFVADVYYAALSPDIVAKLKAVTQANQATLFMTLMAVFGVVLARHSGQDDLVVATPIANRKDAQLDDLIGFFVNTLALRLRVTPQHSFGELLTAVRRTTLDAYEHQDVPFERVIEALNVPRSLSTPPLVQVLFTLQNAPWVEAGLEGMASEIVATEERRVRFDLEVFVWEHGDTVGFAWLYNRDLFDRDTVEALARHYDVIARAMADDPSEPIGRRMLLTSAEIATLLDRGRGARVHCREDTLLELFAATAVEHADSVAIASGTVNVSYRCLDVMSNHLARRLRASGAGPERVIGIAMGSSIESLVAVLAALKSGGAYMPLNLDYPRDYLAHLVQDVGPVCILTTPGGEEIFSDHGTVLVVSHLEPYAAEDPSTGASWPEARAASRSVHGLHAAYVMHTSGSTGRPKAVVMCHAPLVNLLHWTEERVRRNRALHRAPLSFDVSFYEIFGPWATGGVVSMPTGAAADPLALAIAINTDRIMRAVVPVALLGPLSQELSSLEGVSCELTATGERLYVTDDTRHLLLTRPGVRLRNDYGPTETHVVTSGEVTAADVLADVGPPIGTPIWNVECYVLDRNLHVVAAGRPGELYIAGAALARGYWCHPGLTASRFVADPFSTDGRRMYRTGDRVVWLPDERLGFLGRQDRQVKIRGHRVELREVEAVLERIPGVDTAIAVAEPVGDGLELHAYVRGPRLSAETTAGELRALSARLCPPQLVPASLVIVDQWPLTANGKVDVQALRATSERRPVKSSSAPEDPIEAMLWNAYRQVLGTDHIDVDDDFFELGGHSLKVMRLVSVIRKVSPYKVTMLDVFDHRTIRQLAGRIGAADVLVHRAVEHEERLI